MQAETSRCHVKDHPEFTLVYDEHLTSRLGIPWLTTWLEERVLSGEVFQPGESLQVGWMYDQIVSRPNGTLGILEPDFQAVPVEWIEGVSLTLRHLWFQKEVAASVALSPSFPSYRQSAILCSRLRNAPIFMMHREEPEGFDSGWFIGCFDDHHDHQDPAQLTSASLFEAAVRWDQRFIAYAALPPGCYVVAGKGAPSISMHDRPLDIAPRSLLSAFGVFS